MSFKDDNWLHYLVPSMEVALIAMSNGEEGEADDDDDGRSMLSSIFLNWIINLPDSRYFGKAECERKRWLAKRSSYVRLSQLAKERGSLPGSHKKLRTLSSLSIPAIRESYFRLTTFFKVWEPQYS